ncbi:MAG: hypothetical protein RI909_1133 [Bacteroidota bacterium]|jgi:uncharacterized RDD family membrane protein YckC
MQTIQVRTTQNVFIQYPLASVGDRILAYLLDQLIKIIYALAAGILLFNMEVENEWVWILILGFPWLFYSVLFEIFMNGQTPGKRSLNIKVIRLNGTPATLGDYILRWVFALIDFGIFSGAVAVIIIAAGGKGQRLGDLVAGTSVIKMVEQKEITAQEVFVAADVEYEPTFNQAIQLSDKDIEIIHRALEVNRDHGNAKPMLAVAEKIKSQLGIQTDLPPVKFLYVLIKDFNHLTSR